MPDDQPKSPTHTPSTSPQPSSECAPDISKSPARQASASPVDADGTFGPARASTTVTPFKRGWANGSRTDFFKDCLPDYLAARARGPSAVNDALTYVVNMYCQKFTWWLDAPVETTDADRAFVDADLPAALLATKPSKLQRLLTGVRHIMERLATHSAPITKMSAEQIRRDPVASLIASIGNAKVELLRARTPYQLWSKHSFKNTVSNKVNADLAEDDLPAAKYRIRAVQANTKEAFEALPAAERKVWQLEHEAEKASIMERKKNATVLAGLLGPQETQDVLDGLVNKICPLLDGIAELTGGNTHFYWAGPEPARGGQINVISMHSGSDGGHLPVTFGQAGGEQAVARRRLVDAAFGDFALRAGKPGYQASRTLPGVPPCTAPPAFLRWRPVSWTEQNNDTVGKKEEVVASLPSAQLLKAKSDHSRKRRRSKEDQSEFGDANLDNNNGEKLRKRQKTLEAASDDEEEFMGDGLSDDDEGPDIGPNIVPERGTRKSSRTKASAHLNLQNTIDNLMSFDDQDAASHAAPPITGEIMDTTLPMVAGTSSSTGPGNAVDTIGSTKETASAASDDDVVARHAPEKTTNTSPVNNTLPVSNDDDKMDIDPPATLTPEPAKDDQRDEDTSKDAPTTQKAKQTKGKGKTKAKAKAKAVTAGVSSEDLPKYLKDTVPKFKTIDDPTWQRVVNKFVAFERHRKFNGDYSLRNGSRPEVVKTWVKSRRSFPAQGALPSFFPASLASVAETFWCWWRYLQPEWREVTISSGRTNIIAYPLTADDRDTIVFEGENNWVGLDVSGINGFLNIMAYLHFWGLKVSLCDGKGHGGWCEAMADVEWVLERMTEA